MLELIAVKGIYILMVFAAAAAFASSLLPNLFHGALALAAVLLAVAGLYLSLGAEFLAMVQILVYVGAVMTLVIYAVMLTGRLEETVTPSGRIQRAAAGVSCAIFFVLVCGVLLSTNWPAAPGGNPLPSVKDLGIDLMKRHVFPFEVLGILLFAVLIGALAAARREKT